MIKRQGGVFLMLDIPKAEPSLPAQALIGPFNVCSLAFLKSTAEGREGEERMKGVQREEGRGEERRGWRPGLYQSEGQ